MSRNPFCPDFIIVDVVLFKVMVYLVVPILGIFINDAYKKELKDLSQFQWKSSHAPKKELPKDFFVTKSDENHTMSLFNPILDIPERS